MRRKLALVTVASILTLTFVFTGCGSNKKTSGAPTVTSTQPANGATGVSTTVSIQITFSGAVNPSTVNTSTIQLAVKGGAGVAGTVNFDATTNTAMFTPSASLAGNTTYTLTVSGVASTRGATMSAVSETFTTGASSTTTTQYQVSVWQTGAPIGQVSIDTSGNVSFQLSGATANTTFDVQFCPAYPADFTAYNCFSVGNVSTDANGNTDTTMKFPQSGSWAGDFQFLVGGNISYQTDVQSGSSSQVFVATLQPQTTVNGKGVLQSQMTQAPLGSGTISYSSGSLQFVLNGTLPNTQMGSNECPTVFNSSCYALYNAQGGGTFTTDANGNLTFSVLQDGVFGDMFQVGPNSGNDAGWIGGFSIP